MKHPALRACRLGAVSLLVPLLISCGDQDVRITLPPPEPAPEPTPPDPALQPPPPAGDTPQLPEVPAPLSGIADERTLETMLQQDPLAQGVVRMLQSNCGDCHGGDREADVLGDPTDLAAQIARGNVVPGSAAQSPLVLGMLDDSSHPRPRQRPSRGELTLLTRFIDQLPAAPPAECTTLPFQSTDALYAALLADVSSAPPEDRPFLRYAGLTYASNAGWCGAALERQRAALFKLVNSVSTTPDVVVPRALDEHGLSYRLDLRDYGWNRAIVRAEQGSEPHADGWAAIVAHAGSYSLELQGSEADELKRETGALVPYLPAHALLHAAAGEAYYQLLGVPDSIYEAEAVLGIDLQQQLLDGLVQHAGFTGRRADSLVRRVEQSAPGRYYWLIDTQNNTGSESIFEDPFGSGYPVDALFHLPNGLFAYHLEDGYRSSNSALDAHSPGREVASCHACHHTGILPVMDMVRNYVEQNVILFDRDTVALVEKSYPLPSELDALILSDNQLHASASERAGVSGSGPDPLSHVYYQFELDPLSLSRVAAELGVTPDQLQAQLPELDPRLRALDEPGGSVSRGILAESYAQSSCILHAAARNRPVSCP